jgi:hypothetical protein
MPARTLVGLLSFAALCFSPFLTQAAPFPVTTTIAVETPALVTHAAFARRGFVARGLLNAPKASGTSALAGDRR